MPSEIVLLPPVFTYSEEELIALLRGQSRDAFNYLYKSYSGALYGIIRRVISDEQTAQDVLQEAFVKIWQNISRYESGKGRLYTWMLNIARNSAIDKLRSKGEIMKSKIHADEFVVNNWVQERGTEQVTDAIGLDNIVAELKPEQFSIVDLAYFKGYTLDEISKELNMPLGTVKTRMRAAMQQLRTKFKR